MEDLATLQGWLTDAQTARHNLLTGKAAQTVSAWGKSRSYHHTDLKELEKYIGELEGKILRLQTGRGRRPILVSY